MTLSKHYWEEIENGNLSVDPQQIAIIEQLEQLSKILIERQHSFFKKITRKMTSDIPAKGFYLWGDVGIGKSFLMKSFYNHLPFKNKIYIHFHAFMQQIHQELKQLQGKNNPLDIIAKKWSKQACVICFDELFVNDIADAMLLAGLFKALFKEGICILFTSNFEPDKLYFKGLQRDRFLPAIELIKQHTYIIHLVHQKDYRSHHFDQTHHYFFTPLSAQSEQKLNLLFHHFSEKQETNDDPLYIHNRSIRVRKKTDKIVWFDFLDICGIPRHQNDYLELVKQFDTVFISGITRIKPDQNDLARCFINFIDVIYDAKTRLIVSSETMPECLYREGRLITEYARTRSRLMQILSCKWPC